MEKRKSLLILLLIAALALSGCGGQKEDVSPTAEPDAGQEINGPVMDQAQGKLGENVRALIRQIRIRLEKPEYDGLFTKN